MLKRLKKIKKLSEYLMIFFCHIDLLILEFLKFDYQKNQMNRKWNKEILCCTTNNRKKLEIKKLKKNKTGLLNIGLGPTAVHTAVDSNVGLSAFILHRTAIDDIWEHFIISSI